jgi:hypothetical protein
MYIQDRHKQMFYEYKGTHIFFKTIISKVIIFNNISNAPLEKPSLGTLKIERLENQII